MKSRVTIVDEELNWEQHFKLVKGKVDGGGVCHLS